MDAPVLFGDIPTTQGARIATATLNRPAALNALTLEMVKLLTGRLRDWAQDPDVVAVWLDGHGGKAFCAGADLQALYKAMTAQGGFPQANAPALAAEFFSAEYRLDHVIHHYPKPIIAWLDGYVMGGGLGLVHGASHRLATERSIFSMPEMTIGLFPDVGASRFLGQLPLRLGRFLALTAARLESADALSFGLADLPVHAADKETVQAALSTLPWQRNRRLDAATISDTLVHLADWARLGTGTLTQRIPEIAPICATSDVKAFSAALAKAAHTAPWLEPYRQAFSSGAPSTGWLSWRLQELAPLLSLAQTYRLEFDAAIGCCLWGDFAEGIRALIVDKDRHPRWRSRSDANDPEEKSTLEFLLESRAGDSHPLADLNDPAVRE